MKPALLIVDMLKDTFEGHSATELVQAARNFLLRLNEWLDWFHEQKFPVVFACDSFLADDFIFGAEWSRTACAEHGARR